MFRAFLTAPNLELSIQFQDPVSYAIVKKVVKAIPNLQVIEIDKDIINTILSVQLGSLGQYVQALLKANDKGLAFGQSEIT